MLTNLEQYYNTYIYDQKGFIELQYNLLIDRFINQELINIQDKHFNFITLLQNNYSPETNKISMQSKLRTSRPILKSKRDTSEQNLGRNITFILM